MSLLADLLSKVKHQGIKRDVPPNLKYVVEDSTERAAMKKKVIILSVLVLVAVITGVVAVYFLEIFVKPAAVTGPVRLHPSGAQTPPFVEHQAKGVPIAQNQQTPPSPVNQPKTGSEASGAKSQEAKAEDQGPITKKHASKKRGIIARANKRENPSREDEPPVQPSVNQPLPAENTSLPGHLSREQSETRDMHLYAAKTYESKKDYQQALSNYMEALELEPGNYLIMNNISGVMLMLGRYNDALRYAKNALARNYNYVPALVNTGIASIELNNAAEGKKYLTIALALDPSNRSTLLNLAILNEKTGEFGKAHSSFYKLAELGDVRGYLGLAREAERDDKYTDAARIYREILSMNDIDPKIKKLANERLQAIGDKQ